MGGPDAALATVVRERARVLAPALFAGMAVFVGLAPQLGLRPQLGAYICSVVLLAVLGMLSLAMFRRRIPDRWSHAASTLTWWCPVGAALITQFAIRDNKIVLLLLVLIASAGVLLHTRFVIGSLLAVVGVELPLLLRDAGPDTSMLVSTVLTSAMFAVLIHALMRKALLRAEAHRLAAAETAQKLARQLAELERSHEERRRLHDQLSHAQRIEVAGTLAAGLAHDMNNVLAAITAVAEIVQQDLGPSSTSRADVKQIITQAARGAELTRGLLAFSRRGQYRKQTLLVHDIVEDVVPILSRTLPKTIEVCTRLEAGAACVDGDPAQLAQVLVNFAVNGADAMSGQGRLEIVTDVVDVAPSEAAALGLTAASYVRIRVTDTGTGMDEATRQRVFEPFYTTKALGKGTGLGLSTVWGIVQNHRGNVDVRSELGNGSTFTVYLPISHAIPTPLTKTPASGIARTRTVTTVLVIDDEPAVRSGTMRLLERAGFEVLAATNGAEGLDVFREHRERIGLVILDMGMPVMNGAECFERIREISDVPVLIATGYAVDAEAQEMVARGATLIEKPFRSAHLMREVERLVPADSVKRIVA